MSTPVVGDERARLHQDANLLTRLDRMPMTKTIWGILILLVLGWLVESFDIGVVGTIILDLKKIWHLTPSSVGLLGISSTLGVVVGLIPAGRIADRFGRKTVLLWGMAIFSIFTVASVLAYGLPSLFVLRFLAGLGEGAVFPIPYLMFSEFVNANKRTTANGWAELVLTAGYTLPSLTGLWAITTFPLALAWKVPLYIGAIPLLLLIPLWIWVPESPRFLLKHNKADQVKRFVHHLEDEAHLSHDETLLNPQILEVLQQSEHQRIKPSVLFHRPYLMRSFVSYAALTSTFVVWYALLTYAPTIFTLMGAKAGTALLFTSGMMFIAGFGALLQGFLGDKFGRRTVHISYMVLSGLALFVLSLKLPISIVVSAAIITALLGLGGFSIPKIYVAEQYPTRLRGTGVAFGELTSRFLTGVVLIYFIPTMLATWHVTVTFAILAGVMILLVLPMALFGSETARKSVEETGTQIIESPPLV